MRSAARPVGAASAMRGRLAGGMSLGETQQQQTGDGGGLAGAGAAGNQQQGAAQRQRGGLGLAILAGGRAGKQRSKHRSEDSTLGRWQRV